MEEIIAYEPKYEPLVHMPEEMLPPESLYRFKPKRKLLFKFR